ncbi:PIN domain-like protein [Coprinellus micaceus]|uniref:PIN domain-like protein n=1 Tax=Coprinellus micaceus TaxID=71717 RepID=A0A4Y7TJ16_COPMI|nr:PIN domain-like protein [Coprinellus micaceus]TEB34150.1 PIN domain-like protein [Coprinellus micaceus]
MGVQGFLPFLRKCCPDVFRTLPQRFREIEDSRVVIDGTLITQRFHFSPSPHPYRHVLGWYRVAEEMRQSRVTATCIFDGKARHNAKMKEVKRRREAQKITAARGQIEGGRLHRLSQLNKFILSLPTLTPAVVQQSLEALERLSSKDAADKLIQNELETLNSQASDRALSELSTPPLEELVHAPPERAGAPTELATLYDQFKQSVSQLVTITDEGATPIPSLTAAEDREIEVLVTKAQAHLAVRENALWTHLSVLNVEDKEGLDYLTTLAKDIVGQSQGMSNSFERRTNLPTATTYHESREILEAMGIRCVESEGKVEAEGLASAMVLCGHADYVASEDTDVLVYGATLMRNFGSNNVPLELISGEDIQAALGLSREAYVDFALLLGTDFSQRLKNVGPVRALKFLHDHGGIEGILAAEVKYPPRASEEEYLAEVIAGRSIFEGKVDLPGPLIGEVAKKRDEQEIQRLLQKYKLDSLVVDGAGWYDLGILSDSYFSDNPVAA